MHSVVEARSSASGKNLGKMGTTAKMVTQHGKVECSDTKLGTVSMALFRGSHWVTWGQMLSRKIDFTVLGNGWPDSKRIAQ